MKVLLAPHGTRGDVQPLLALARGLRERGHEPSFLVPDDCVRWIRDSGFPCEPNGIDVAGTFGSRGAAVASGRWPWRQFVDVVVPALFNPLSHLTRHATLLAADPDLAPLGDDAPLTVIPTDAWVLDDRQPDLDPRIARFLDLNPAPIYVEFDSMNASRAGELADHVVAAGHAVGRGVLMAGGQASLGQDIVDSEDVLAAGELPHQAVLPRVAVAVHHGDADTTTA